ncbi:hypothetical protein LCGC14_3047900 [marine sediment metagenome]|uniref:KH type-2 domain-containing protein n=1 Tax=marine sediment metagenome TaxID=412755 RepID=A0A0F8YVI0_9ZZZZ
MFYTILDDLILYQMLYFFKKYSNYELKLHRYFYEKTQIDPTYITVVKIEDIEYIFFFIKKESYLEARAYLNLIRKEFRRRIFNNKQNNKKVIIIKVDYVFIQQVFNFFPDLNIYDIQIKPNDYLGLYEISVLFLKDLNIFHVAVGRNGGYIKAINALFEENINFENRDTPVKIKCSVIS